MKLIKPKFEIIEQQAGLEGIYKAIELAGRTCYKSENLITEDSARGFVERMINNKHYAMLEHGTIYLKMEGNENISNKYQHNKYSKVNFKYSDDPNIPNIYDIPTHYITTNLRVLVENDWLDDLKYISELTEYHEKRYCVRFTCDRGVSHEFVRHRVMSFAQESTRYCNYSKDKFGNELTYIIPSWSENIREDSNEGWDPCTFQEKIFLQTLQNNEESYFLLLDKWNNKKEDKRFKTGFKDNPWTPQQARQVLPNALKTELVMTGFTSDWEHFFELRDAGSAHPDAQALAKPLHEEFIKRNYIKD